MDSSDKVPAFICLCSFCPVHSKSGRTRSSLTTGHERKGNKHFRLPLHCWAQCGHDAVNNPHLNRHVYANSQRTLLPLAHGKLQTFMMWLFCYYPVPFPVSFHFFEALKVHCNADCPIQKAYMYKQKKELVALSYF